MSVEPSLGSDLPDQSAPYAKLPCSSYLFEASRDPSWPHSPQAFVPLVSEMVSGNDRILKPLCMHAASKSCFRDDDGCHFRRQTPPPTSMSQTGDESLRVSNIRTYPS